MSAGDLERNAAMPAAQAYGSGDLPPRFVGTTVEPGDSPQVRKPFQVHQEDCEFDGVVVSSSSQAIYAPHNQWGSASKVYVQNPRAPSKFRPVASDRAQRVYQAPEVSAGSAVVKTASGRAGDTSAARRAQRQGSVSIAALHTAARGVEALGLSSANSEDRSVFRLLAKGEESRLFSSLVFFGLQAVLAGLSFMAGAMSYADKVRLVTILELLEPGFTGVTLACSEVACVGAIVRLMHLTDNSSSDFFSDTLAQDQEVRQAAWGQAPLVIASALANLFVVVCCLLAFSDDGTYGIAVWARSNPEKAELLLWLRAGFGIFAALLRLYDMQYIVSPVIPVNALSSFLDNAAIASTDGNVVMP